MSAKDDVRQRIEQIILQLKDTKSGAGKFMFATEYQVFLSDLISATGLHVLHEQKLSDLESLVGQAFFKHKTALQDYAIEIMGLLIVPSRVVINGILKQAFDMIKGVGTNGAKRLPKDNISNFLDCVIDTIFSVDTPTVPNTFEIDLFYIIKNAFTKIQNTEDRILYTVTALKNIISWKP